MRPLELGALYLLVGAGCAAAYLAVGSQRDKAATRRAADAVLLLALWPLCGPFLLTRQGTEPDGGGAAEGEAAFLITLRRASASPLAALLPDEATVRALGRRLRVAASKVAEIEALLSRPEFAEDAALSRLQELEARHASQAALSTVRIRLQNIRRLRTLRERFARELDEVRELQAQLGTHAEVVRLAGVPDAEAADLVQELVARVAGLDQVLEEDAALRE